MELSIRQKYDLVEIKNALDIFSGAATDFAVAVVILTLTAVLAIHGIYELGLRSRINRFFFSIWYIRALNSEKRIWKKQSKKAFKASIFSDRDFLSVLEWRLGKRKDDGFVNILNYYSQFIKKIVSMLSILLGVLFGKRFVISSQAIPSVMFSLQYQQFCSQIDMIVQSEFRSFNEESPPVNNENSFSDKDKSNLEKNLLRAWPQLVDMLQTFMGTWWIRINYVLTGFQYFQ